MRLGREAHTDRFEGTGTEEDTQTKAPAARTLGLSALAVLILSTGFFVGFAAYVPIQRLRAQLRSAERKEAEERRLAGHADKAAPPIVSRTLSGEQWQLASQKGKVVLVYVWSILCDDCVRAIPVLDRIHATYGGRADFALVGVHRFPQRDVIASYCSAKGISWLQLYEDSEGSPEGFVDTLGISRTPSVCIIDRQGTVRVLRAGLGDVEAEVRGLLESNAGN